MPEFSAEWIGSYLLVLQKPSSVIHGIVPTDIWRLTTGHAICQATQQTTVKHVSTLICQKMVILIDYIFLILHIQTIFS